MQTSMPGVPNAKSVSLNQKKQKNHKKKNKQIYPGEEISLQSKEFSVKQKIRRQKKNLRKAKTSEQELAELNATQILNESEAISYSEDYGQSVPLTLRESTSTDQLLQINLRTSLNIISMATNKEKNRAREHTQLQSPKTVSMPHSVPENNTVLSHEIISRDKPELSVLSIPHGFEKSREDIKAEREAKKLAKQIAKIKVQDSERKTAGQNEIVDKSVENVVKCHVGNIPAVNKITPVNAPSNNNCVPETIGKSHEEIFIEHEKKKISKLIAKNPEFCVDEVDKAINAELSENIQLNDETKKAKISTKAERRAIQEAQRLAKNKALVEKQEVKKSNEGSKDKIRIVNSEIAFALVEKCFNPNSEKHQEYKVKLFNHLNGTVLEHNLFINSAIHPAIVQLGEQYSKRTIVGSNARCIAFLKAIQMVIQDYVTPPKKEFARGLESTIKYCVDQLQECRPLAVSIINAHKYIKFILTQLPTDLTDSKLKENLSELLDNYIRDQIDKAAEAISSSVQDKISNGDVILTFGCSSLINHILEEAHRRNVDFRVILVDSRPFLEGQELLRRLVSKGIACTCVLINAVVFVMPEVTKVLLGAHALLANGYVMARAGTAQVALVARSFNVPILVCCETHKFSERVQTDAIVFNELGSPDDVVTQLNVKENRLTNWQSFQKLYPLNLIYDITPPELVTAVVTEVAILPCTSVPVILRIKPTEILY